MPIWVKNAQGQTEVDSPWSKQTGYSFFNLYRTHKMCLFSPASEWPSLGGMEKIPHFYKAKTKGVSLFDILIKSKFYFFETLISFKNIFVCSRIPQVKGHMPKSNWYMDKTKTGKLANAQEERDASNRLPSQIMGLISNFFKISKGNNI